MSEETPPTPSPTESDSGNASSASPASPAPSPAESDSDAASTASAGPGMQNLVAELVGTTIVMLLGPGIIVLSGGRVSDLTVAIGFGIGTAIAIGVIGAVANPMFTFALLLVREITPREAAGDWAGQLFGGVIGGALIWGINDQQRSGLGATGWDRNGFSEVGSVLSAELVFGLLIVLVLLAAISQGLSRAGVAAFTGAGVAGAQLVLLPIDGGGANPARSVGSAIFSDTDPSALGQVWLFVLVPMVAALAAVFVWLAIDDAEIDDTVFDDTLLDDAQNALTGDTD